ncbi:hypothetical protein [Novosphingobium mangrovi (ex Huang et al. 2023)]|uniref:Uncharacterized protein n=1 Tax=Novosphingobium mangrovi (ex Huang et al. 2023) TaxID=2976432 RepID=A0ABT2I3Y5_9SPHN|nr:hypothetical protein [Novosphingobium mangrovi (ex Huang et al. 2023)]MCT2399511.1 hypothetical protein [Novosphingobium mangrovi (ex Huang et al. 2023)]
MSEPAGAGHPSPRAFLKVAGASLAQHQLGLVLALDCQRVICMARGTAPEIIALQHAAEDAGLQFAIVTSPRQLAGLVTATDEVIVVSEGLFVEAANAVPLLEGRRPVVLVQPVEGALAAGYERIDINRASAGIMRIPGQLVERLHELPGDCDIASALTRIALQSGAEMREVPATARTGADWSMVRTESEAFALENDWLRARFADGPTSPGRAAARFSVVHFGSSLLHAGNASNALSAGVLGMLVIAAGLGWFGVAWGGFLFVALAWVLAEASRRLRSAERHALGQLPPAIPRADVLVWLIDTALGILILANTPRFPGQLMLSWLSVPAILLMLLALVPRVVRGLAASWLGDRMVLAFVLAVAAAAGQLLPAVQVVSMALIVSGLLFHVRLRN